MNSITESDSCSAKRFCFLCINRNMINLFIIKILFLIYSYSRKALLDKGPDRNLPFKYIPLENIILEVLHARSAFGRIFTRFLIDASTEEGQYSNLKRFLESKISINLPDSPDKIKKDPTSLSCEVIKLFDHADELFRIINSDESPRKQCVNQIRKLCEFIGRKDFIKENLTQRRDWIGKILTDFSQQFETSANYIHLIGCHAIDQIETHGNLLNYSQEASESVNYTLKQIYRNHTNKQTKGEQNFLLQILRFKIVNFLSCLTFTKITSRAKSHSRNNGGREQKENFEIVSSRVKEEQIEFFDKLISR
eukprot:gb/GECH01009214.1/.p1 GENE.gb/GECH01009214.1/~~gb/GECH01009214.1/.p1  ORF type:complete len:308 (+),score=6.22 gb/GECH01009214.1/:1-924(+)